MTVGAALTVKAFDSEPAPSSGLVTVTVRAPVLADAVMLMLAVSSVEEMKLVELTVMPAPENVTAAPLTKPVPLIVIGWFDAP